MNLKVKSKMAGLILAGSVFALSSCGKPEEVKAEIIAYPIEQSIDLANEDSYNLPVLDEVPEIIEEPKIVEPVDEDSIEYNTNSIDVIYAIENVNIRESNSTESDRLGVLVPGRAFELLSDEDPEWFLINYYGQPAYVFKEYAYKDTKLIPNIPIINKGYINEETKLYSDKELTQESMDLQFEEFIEVRKELDNCYLVSTIDGIGYIQKDKLNVLDGKVAVVDISNQQINIYVGNELKLVAPVITGSYGNPERESDTGLYDINNERHNLWITADAYVDNMLNYNGGEALHDAYRWRQPWMYGGETYKYNGSAGCINMREDEANYMADLLDIGDKVLVKG